jgi:hypothetical protein
VSAEVGRYTVHGADRAGSWTELRTHDLAAAVRQADALQDKHGRNRLYLVTDDERDGAPVPEEEQDAVREFHPASEPPVEGKRTVAVVASLLLAVALSACGVAPMAATDVPAAPVSVERAKGAGLELCEMHVEEPEPGIYLAVYDTPALCGVTPEDPNPPTWVYIDYFPEAIDFAVRLYPHGKKQPSNRGWYMHLNGPTGGPYQIQARAGVNNGRATVACSVTRGGSVCR